MTDQATAETTAQQPGRPAPAKHDTLAVLAFIFGILLWPLGIYLGHASCQEAVLAGRKRSALALARDDRGLRGRVRHIRAIRVRPGRVRDRPWRLSGSSVGLS